MEGLLTFPLFFSVSFPCLSLFVPSFVLGVIWNFVFCFVFVFVLFWGGDGRWGVVGLCSTKFSTQIQTQTSRYAGASKVMVRVTVDCTSENRELAAKIDVEGGKTTTVALDCAPYLQVTCWVNLCHFALAWTH
jgi:hypothetical protein